MDYKSLNLPSEDEMRQYLIDRNIGYDFKTNKSKIPKLKKDKLEKCYKVCVIGNNYGDISKIKYEDIKDFDLFNFSFPCTDISIAGKQKGMTDINGNKTSSGLYINGIELIKIKKPKYIMIENVKNLISKKFINDFNSLINKLKALGYKCYYPTKNGKPKCLNAKDYGIPQNRERIFIICVRNDIKLNFEFPKEFDNGLRLKGLLEDEVDKKYYLSKEIQDRFKRNNNKDINRNELNIMGTTAPEFRTIGERDITYGINGVISTLTATDYKQPKQILELNKDNSNKEISTLNNESESISKNSFIDKYDRIQLFETKENYIQWDTSGKGYNSQQDRAYYQDKLCPTLSYCNTNGNKSQVILKNKENIEQFSKSNKMQDNKKEFLEILNHNKNVTNSFKIRKLTPKECWRLMGFGDECFNEAKEQGISDTQLYKQAGNSIVVNVLYYIFLEIFKNKLKY